MIVSRPIKSGCSFNCLNPIIYNLLREDYQFDQINDNGGDAQFQINGVDLTSYFEVGDSIYAEGNGGGTITVMDFTAGNTYITADIPFTSSSAGYINNNSKRTDHQIQVEVFDYDTDESLGPRIIVEAGEDGTAKADISGVVKSFLYPDWEDVALNEVEAGTSKKVYISTQEFYDDTLWIESSDSANPIIAVFGFIPLLLNSPPNFTRYAHGGNLLSYFPLDSSRKFLNRFLSPSLWRGYPFSISFIWPESIASIDRRVKQYDSEGNELSDDLEPLESGFGSVSGDTFQPDRVHRLSVGTIHADAVEILLSLESAAVQITEEITIKVKDHCEVPILLFWKNCLGGDQFWLFDESQEYEHTYPSGRKVKRIQLFSDNLTLDEWDGLNDMHSVTDIIASNIVDYELSNTVDKTHFRNDQQVFIISSDAEKVGVITVASGDETKTIYKKHAIQVTIELPEFFTV